MGRRFFFKRRYSNYVVEEMKVTYILIIVITILLFSSIITLANGLQAVVKGINEFGLDLYRELKEKEGNLFFSPYSIFTALAMAYAGARGLTEEEMAKVLHFPLKQEPLHSSLSKFKSRLEGIQDKGHIQLTTANSLWVQEGYHFLNTFFDLNKKYYGACLNFVDFTKKPEAARKVINLWVKDKTQEKINELIKPNMINPLTTLILCNVIYFKGKWLNRFDKERTKEANFYISPCKAIKVPMMNQRSRFKFRDFGSFTTIELPYEGRDLSMIILLPKEVDGLPRLEKDLTEENLRTWIDKLYDSHKLEILVSLPRFKTTCGFELGDLLSKMGMPSAFSPSKADFSGMTGRKELFINKAIHKALVDVNEEGTEAAAATAVIIGKTAIRPLTFRADHPFIFLIRENQTGTILFMGRILDPTK